MNNRIWVLGTVIVSLAVIVLGFFLGVSPKLSEIATNAVNLAAADAQNAQYQAELESLKAQYETIDDVRAELEELRQTLPADGDYANLLRELDAAAIGTGVSVTSYAQAAPVLYGPTVVADPAAADPAAADPNAASTTGTPISGGTLLGIPLTITVVGPDQMSLWNYVDSLRLGQRLFLLTGFDISPNTAAGGAGFIMNFTASVFTLIDPSAVPADAVAPTDPTSPDTTPAPTETATTPPESTGTPVPSDTPTSTP